MAEIEITLPTVTYGNVKVRLNPQELGADVSDAAAIGAATAVYLNLFTQGWKQGAALDVTAEVHVGKPKEEYPTREQINKALSDMDVDTEAEAVAELKRLGATVVSEEDTLPGDTVPDDEPEDENDNIPMDRAAQAAPWEKTSPVAAKPKPWENGGSSKPAKVAEIDWS